jgi:hypothetical protein
MRTLTCNQSLGEFRVVGGVIKFGFPYKGDGLGPCNQFATGRDPAVFSKGFVGHLAVTAEIDGVPKTCRGRLPPGLS